MSTIVDILSIMNMNLHNESKAIIEELASIKHMERGKLTSEYRTRTNPDGKEISLGPYYKHQAREDGKNKSRRIPAKDVPIIEQDIASYQKFKSLVSTLENTIITKTREIRNSHNETKKNSTNK